jgi:F0F1-type ATP synthase assembly protein I
MSQQPTPREMGYYMALAQVGVEMVVPIVAGHYLDEWLDTNPWITGIAAVAGFVLGMVHLILILRQKDRDETSQKKPPP